jgi:hypothetical protein
MRPGVLYFTVFIWTAVSGGRFAAPFLEAEAFMTDTCIGLALALQLGLIVVLSSPVGVLADALEKSYPHKGRACVISLGILIGATALVSQSLVKLYFAPGMAGRWDASNRELLDGDGSRLEKDFISPASLRCIYLWSFALRILYSAGYVMVEPVLDGLTLSHLKQEGRDDAEYGKERLFGAVGWAFGNSIMGKAIDVWGFKAMYGCNVAAALICFATIILFVRSEIGMRAKTLEQSIAAVYYRAGIRDACATKYTKCDRHEVSEGYGAGLTQETSLVQNPSIAVDKYCAAIREPWDTNKVLEEEGAGLTQETSLVQNPSIAVENYCTAIAIREPWTTTKVWGEEGADPTEETPLMQNPCDPRKKNGEDVNESPLSTQKSERVGSEQMVRASSCYPHEVSLSTINEESQDDEAIRQISGTAYWYTELQPMIETMFSSLHGTGFMFAFVLLSMGGAVVENLVFLFYAVLGSSYTVCGLSVIVTVLFEVPIFALAPALLRIMGPNKMLQSAILAFIIRVTAYTFVPKGQFGWLLLIESLHGISYAFYKTSGVEFVAQLAPVGSEATAQGILNALRGLGSVVGLSLAGWAQDSFGPRIMYRSFGVFNLLGIIVLCVTEHRYGSSGVEESIALDI